MNIFQTKHFFDQNKESPLPKKIVHIVKNCASRAATGVLTERSRQLTEAMMLMKLYQAYGNESRRYTASALELLHTSLGIVSTGTSADKIGAQTLA